MWFIIGLVFALCIGFFIRWLLRKNRPASNQVTAAPPSPPEQPAVMSSPAAFCPNCGTKIAGGSVFCSNCGAKVN